MFFILLIHLALAVSPKTVRRPRFPFRIRRWCDRSWTYPKTRCSWWPFWPTRKNSGKTRQLSFQASYLWVEKSSFCLSNFTNLVSIGHPILSLDVRLVISECQESIVIHEIVDDILELIGTSWREKSTLDLVDHLLQLGQCVVIVLRIVTEI